MIYMRYIQTYFNIHRILLLLIGVWPYQQSKLIRIQFFLLFGIVTTYLIAQLGVIFISRCTTDVVLEIIFITSFLAISAVFYATFYFNSEVAKLLIDQIECHYDKLKDENEIAIMDEYGNKTKRVEIVIIVLFVCVIFGLCWVQFWPHILNVILPVNKTRTTHIIQALNHYIFDPEKYFYLLLLHSNMTFCICGFSMVGVGGMLLACGQHICAMFRVASYRIEHTMSLYMLRSTKPRDESLIYQGIIYAIDIHRNTLQFSELLMSGFSICFASMLMDVISISFNLMIIFLALSSEYDVEELIMQCFLLLVQYFYIFVINFVCQEIMDHSNHIFDTVYNTRWYVAPIQTQKMILFLLQRGTQTYSMNLKGIFVGSLKGFASLLSSSISYFTVLYSTQQ